MRSIIDRLIVRSRGSSSGGTRVFEIVGCGLLRRRRRDNLIRDLEAEGLRLEWVRRIVLMLHLGFSGSRFVRDRKRDLPGDLAAISAGIVCLETARSRCDG